MNKYLKPIIIASATGILSTLAIATTLAFTNGSAAAAVPAFNSSAPLNHSGTYTGTHNSAWPNHSGTYTGTHSSAPLNHSEGYTGTHGEKIYGQHKQYAQNGHTGHGGFAGHGGWDTVTIGGVQADSPAAKAGMKAGDVISQVNGATLSNPAALKSTLAGLKPGDKVTLNLLRNGQAQTVEVILGESPDKKGVPYLGVTFGHNRKHAPKTTPVTTNTVG